jgi:hypothetical protein
LLDLRTGGPGGKMPGLQGAGFARSIKCFGDSRMGTRRFANFDDFYPYYLREHSSRASRRLHVIGTALAIVLLIAALVTRTWNLLWAVPLAGYLFAWVGHFFFEKNQPATFRHPVYSLRGDFVMLRDVLTGKLRW